MRHTLIIISYIVVNDLFLLLDDGMLGYISVRVSDNATIDEHTQSDQCALWDSNTFPEKSSQTLKCGNIMSGRYVSIQRTVGYAPYHMILCEVKVMGDRMYRKYNSMTSVDLFNAKWVRVQLGSPYHATVVALSCVIHCHRSPRSPLRNEAPWYINEIVGIHVSYVALECI